MIYPSYKSRQCREYLCSYRRAKALERRRKIGHEESLELSDCPLLNLEGMKSTDAWGQKWGRRHHSRGELQIRSAQPDSKCSLCSTWSSSAQYIESSEDESGIYFLYLDFLVVSIHAVHDSKYRSTVPCVQRTVLYWICIVRGF